MAVTSVDWHEEVAAVSAIVPLAALGALPRATGPGAGRPDPTKPALPDMVRRLSC